MPLKNKYIWCISIEGHIDVLFREWIAQWPTDCSPNRDIRVSTKFLVGQRQSSWGQHGAYQGPVGPRWAPCWPHEPCYQDNICTWKAAAITNTQYHWFRILVQYLCSSDSNKTLQSFSWRCLITIACYQCIIRKTISVITTLLPGHECQNFMTVTSQYWRQFHYLQPVPGHHEKDSPETHTISSHVTSFLWTYEKR